MTNAKFRPSDTCQTRRKSSPQANDPAASAGGPAGSYLAVAAMAAFIGTLVVGMHEVDDGLKVKGLTKDTLTLTGVSWAFAGAAAGPSQGNQPVGPGRSVREA